MLTVHIWAYRGSAVAWGHASMSLDRTYVSWWPEGSNRVHNKLVGRIYTAGPIRNRTFSDDVAGEDGRHPDFNIRIQGLSEQAIKDWWFRFSLLRDGEIYQGPLRDSWQTLSKNCSTVVARGLTLGGGAELAGFSAARLVWTPNDVRAYAQAIQTALLRQAK